MNKKKIQQLTGILKRLNVGENSAEIKQAAKDFLSTIDPAELSAAEQKLIDAGLAPEDLRHLCSAHLELLDDNLGQMKLTLKPGHVIDTLIKEHEIILDFLDKLEKTNQKIQKMRSHKDNQEEFELLKNIAEHLAAAEPHHQREEKVLFPEIEKRGVFGPPQVMVMEHEDLRRYKKELKKLTGEISKIDFDDFKKRLDTVAKFIIMILRDHIFKENNILYPTALEVIEENGVWKKMKDDCDKIGYCCFTPEQ